MNFAKIYAITWTEYSSLLEPTTTDILYFEDEGDAIAVMDLIGEKKSCEKVYYKDDAEYYWSDPDVGAYDVLQRIVKPKGDRSIPEGYNV